MQYEPTEESVRQHAVPAWFEDAKLGIFIHWGLFSVPGWASVAHNLHEIMENGDWETWFRNNAYAEWYANTIKLEGSPAQEYHQETFGDMPYTGFAPMFNEAITAWNPDAWARTFERVGAQYVVLVTKHHDGFLLWPSEHPNPFNQNYQADRDIVGELTTAVRGQGMEMGLYYSGGLDWTFNPVPIRDITTLTSNIPQGEDYVAYADSHWRELITRYQPMVVWNDIGYPAAANVPSLFADYYNAQPDGVINDRFAQHQTPQAQEGNVEPLAAGLHYDFRTPEYSSYSTIMPYKWEACRGVGFSFGYNQNETDADHLNTDELIRLFVDIVSKNGNLLLNVGPMPDGTIPALQMQRLDALGAWIEVNGAAIFGTRPWIRAEATTTEGIGVRFTQKDDTLYAILLDTPSNASVTIENLHLAPNATITMLGSAAVVPWEQIDDHVHMTLPEHLPQAPAYALAIAPLATIS